MKIRNFNFPEFEEWYKTKEYEEKIGAYTCAIRIFMSGYDENTYVAAISANANPINVYAKKEISDCISCDRYDEQKLQKWYNKVTSAFNEEWAQFLLKTYFDN